MLHTKENMNRDRSKLFLQPGVFSKAEKVMNYVHPDSRNRWVRRQSHSDLRQGIPFNSEEYEQKADPFPAYQDSRWQGMNPFSTRREEKEDEDFVFDDGPMEFADNQSNQKANIGWHYEAKPDFPPQFPHRQLPKSATKTAGVPRKSSVSTNKQKPARGSVKEKSGRPSYSRMSEEMNISQKENMNPQNFTFMRSPSLANVGGQFAEEHEAQIEELNNKLKKLKRENELEKSKNKSLTVEVKELKESLVKERNTYEEELKKITTQIKTLKSVQNMYISEKRASERLENQLNQKNEVIAKMNRFFSQTLNNLSKALISSLEQVDLRQIASGWKMDEELQGRYDRALQELRRALVRVFETSEQANIEYDYSSQKHKELMAQLREQMNIFKELEGHKELSKTPSSESLRQPAKKFQGSRLKSVLNKSAVCLRSDRSKSPDTTARNQRAAVNKSYGDLKSVRLNLKDLQELAKGEPVVYRPLFGDSDNILPALDQETKQPESSAMLKCRIPCNDYINPFDTVPRDSESKNSQTAEEEPEKEDKEQFVSVTHSSNQSQPQGETLKQSKCYDLPLSNPTSNAKKGNDEFSVLESGIQELKQRILQRKTMIEARRNTSLASDDTETRYKSGSQSLQDSRQNTQRMVQPQAEEEFKFVSTCPSDNPEETPNVEKAAVESVQSTNTESDVCQDLYAVARFDYAATKENDISFSKGERIQVLKKAKNGWWIGLCKNKVGYFPFNFVTVETE